MAAEKVAPENRDADAPALRDINEGTLKQILADLTDARSLFARYVTTLTPADRRRLTSVSLKREGFVQMVEMLWKDNTQFAPSYVSAEKINDLNNDYDRYSRIIVAAREVLDMATDAKIYLTAELYRYSLSFYENVKRAALIDRVPEAMALYQQLAPFFKNRANKTAVEPSKKQVLQDAKAIIDGRKEGEIILKNRAPTVKRGEQVIIDRTEKIKEIDEVIDERAVNE